MKQEHADPKQRLIHTAADLLRRRGLSSTSIRELAKHANAPLGSTYHYFPGGKPQLISAAVAQSGQRVSRQLAHALNHGALSGIEAFCAGWRAVLLKGEFKAGCPVIAVAADDSAADGEGLPLNAAATALYDWIQLLTSSLQHAGLTEEEASGQATLVVASIEGAILLCRAQQSIAPFDTVTRLLLRQLRQQLDT